ncbi:MAG TPA: hypothetical protein ENN44_00945 [Methanoculleus sp.]|nr:hypothetical protein [Methanoculleus sp.]
MSKIAVRAYARKAIFQKSRPSFHYADPPFRHSRVLVFDTETTVDEYQNLTIGYFQIRQDDYRQHQGLFYDPEMLDPKESDILSAYAQRNKISLYTVDEFVDGVFYPEVYVNQALCVGFNLPFDLSRIAHKAGHSRKGNKGGFTLTLSEQNYFPPIITKKIGPSYSFKFSSALNNSGENFVPGYFLDVQNFGETLLQSRHISLDNAAEKLQTTTRKMKDVTYGRVTDRFIDYLIADVQTTFEVYQKLVRELDHYQIQIPITKIFSAASMGKYALDQLGIQPFMEKNPDFPPDVLGFVMSAYYGGRTECRMRKTPVKVTTLDFTSMYPTVTVLLDLWPFMIAEKIVVVDVSVDANSDVIRLVNSVNLGMLQDKELWTSFNVLVQIRPDDDILPVRMDYKGDGTTFNVGVNHLTYEGKVWYALPDVIASILLTGKVPTITRAVRFIPQGTQPGLRSTSILGVDVHPEQETLVKVLVEERQKIKQSLTEGYDAEHQKSRAQAMKILVNAMSYGVFIELNPQDGKTALEVTGVESFENSESRYEQPGRFFCPMIGVFITAASRLFLAMAEAKVMELGGRHAYMDTDSIYVPPELAQDVIAYFEPLNPYDLDIRLLKAEKEEVWFYGVSSKRYVLYTMKWKMFNLVDYKLHGLGHLSNPFSSDVKDWQGVIWEDILKLQYGFITEADLIEKYENFFAMSRLTVSTSHVHKRFKTVNKGKEWREQIKPFSFYLAGFHAVEEDGNSVKPLCPFSKESQEVVHRHFIDYQSGEIMGGTRYFKRLGKTILQYLDHPEHKFDGDVGFLERRHIVAHGVIHIGKEANSVSEQALDVKKPQVFVNERELRIRIKNYSYSDWEKAGYSKGTLYYLKQIVGKGKPLNTNAEILKRFQ